MKSVMKHQFSEVPKAEIQRSSFDRSHGYKTSINAGYLYPFYVDEVLPGDTHVLDLTVLARLSTPIAPIMDNMFLDVQYFFVPNRLVWDNWQKMMGERENPDDSIDYTVPIVESDDDGFAVGSIFDYMGLPINDVRTVSNVQANALPARAYKLIYNQWYRDQNLQDALTVPKDDGPDYENEYVLMRRGKRHDYFTSCLPWPQKGPGVEIPLGESAPVIGTGMTLGLKDGTYTSGLGWNSGLSAYGTSYGSNIGSTLGSGTIATKTMGVTDDPDKSGLIADLSEASAATINSWRQAFQLQRMLERDARGGTRYPELLKAHFGVTSPDARLQRSEYLGGGSMRVNVHQVEQNSATSAVSPQGNLAAFGLVAGQAGFTKSFVEHGYIIGIMSVRADLTYQQGMNRLWNRRTRYDYYWPALAHLGEQEVLNKEIYCTGATPQDDEVFGYQERWAEYRYKPSQITGKLRSTVADTLDLWHLSQLFTALPTLSDTFIVENPPIDRVVAVPEEPHFVVDTYTKLKSVRPMPVFSVPGLIDHF